MALNKLSYLDLFSGAGGWSVGFNMAGYEHLAMYEMNASACRTAWHNFGDIVHTVDLSEHEKIVFPKSDLIIGSPPCQGFSNEGKKQKNDPRNDLVWMFLDIVERMQPKAWVFENVPGFKRSYKGHFHKEFTARLNASGYRWRDYILNAADYGVPQSRQRFIILAIKNIDPSPPPSSHLEAPDLLGSDGHVSLWDAISDLPAPALGDRVGIYDYMSPPQSSYQRWARLNSTRIENHTAQNHSKRILEKIMAVPIGGNMSHIVNQFDENKVHYEGGYRRARKDTPSYTAYWTRGMTSIHPDQHRFLTPRECARIQSFPDSFVFKGTTIENYTQICNAVPPLMAYAIAKHLRELITNDLDMAA